VVGLHLRASCCIRVRTCLPKSARTHGVSPRRRPHAIVLFRRWPRCDVAFLSDRSCRTGAPGLLPPLPAPGRRSPAVRSPGPHRGPPAAAPIDAWNSRPTSGRTSRAMLASTCPIKAPMQTVPTTSQGEQSRRATLRSGAGSRHTPSWYSWRRTVMAPVFRYMSDSGFSRPAARSRLNSGMISLANCRRLWREPPSTLRMTYSAPASLSAASLW